MNRKQLLVIASVALLAAVPASFLPRVLAPLEDQVTSLKYAARGTRQADTNIVLVYVDDEAIKTLGWPVRRNFYALMVNVLTELQVRTIGIEVMFEDQKLDFQEYDELLTTVLRRSHRVVLTSYFTAMFPVSGVVPPPSSTRFPNVEGVPLQGSGYHRPFPGLFEAASGVGHVNFVYDADSPFFVRTDSIVVPAFSLEVIRTYLQAGREGVRFDGGRVTINGARGSIEFDVGSLGSRQVDYPGSLAAFHAYPFLEVLRSYDALRADRPTRVPVASFKDKSVLIGVVAEGRSQFYRTPVSARTPSLLLHASCLDNALGRGFPREISGSLLVVLVALVGCAVGWVLLEFRSPIHWIIAVLVVAVAVAAAVALFVLAGILLPVIPIFLDSIIAGFLGLSLRHRRAKVEVDVLRGEKESVLAQLRDREAKLSVLERELVNMQVARSNNRTEELLEEIRRYKEEIRTLASQADDLEAYRSAPDGAGGAMEDFEGLIHDRTGRMREVVEFIMKMAASDAPILVLGESGTGKELVARAIHKRSKRSGGPFVAVNCGALTETLLESELFGHERGSFTGAVKDRMGRFELATGGTILLDEIGEVSENFQVKLLRVLQEGEFERVGGTKTVKVDVRVLAATNRDLREQVRAGKFREDLFYRLNVLTVSLPPLRERVEDISFLVDFFLRREGEGLSISKNAMDALRSYEWRGNVRELESAVKRAVLLARADRRTMIAIKDLHEEVVASGRRALAVESQILDSLREKKFSRSSITETADELGGLNRGTVAEYLRGECLKAFVESGFDLDKAVRMITLTVEPAVLDRVSKRVQEYLQNLIEAVDGSQPWDISRMGLRPKMKNLPQKYHPALEAVAEAYYRGVWKPGR
jgi:transcriptional regulator with GAF, ATPase, and Fis domain/CHASE2 domain-containing sensor protein